MIQLTIRKQTAEGGASKFRMEPAHISLGSMGANGVDQIAVVRPKEWDGMAVRLTFLPEEGEASAVLLDETGTCTLTGDITGAAEAGSILADAVGTDGYTAYSAECRYQAQPHAKAGGKTPSYTKDEYQQFVAAVQGYSATAAAAEQETERLARAVALEAGQVGCRSFQINAQGSLIETDVFTTEEGTQTQSADLGVVSAYAQARQNGFSGTQAEWLASLKGEKGDKGDPGEQGPKGEKGDIGNTGAPGAAGQSAYADACAGGYTGTESDFQQFLAQASGKLSTLQQAADSAFAMQLIWMNPGPSLSFATQTISLDLSAFSMLYIVPIYNNKSICIYPGTLAPVGTQGRLAATQTTTYYRPFSIGQSGVTFGTASSGDTVCIPYAIYGIKGV